MVLFWTIITMFISNVLKVLNSPMVSTKLPSTVKKMERYRLFLNVLVSLSIPARTVVVIVCHLVFNVIFCYFTFVVIVPSMFLTDTSWHINVLSFFLEKKCKLEKLDNNNKYMTALVGDMIKYGERVFISCKNGYEYEKGGYMVSTISCQANHLMTRPPPCVSE